MPPGIASLQAPTGLVGISLRPLSQHPFLLPEENEPRGTQHHLIRVKGFGVEDPEHAASRSNQRVAGNPGHDG